MASAPFVVSRSHFQGEIGFRRAIGVYDTVTATAKQPGAGFSLELEGAYLGDLASSRSGWAWM